MFLKIFIASLVLVVFLILFIKIKNSNSKGNQGEKAVAKVLKKCKGKALNSVYLPLYDTVTEIDHIFISKKGIIVIETKNISGKVSGNANDKYWIHKIGSKTHKLYNPIFQNKTHCDNVSHHLKKFGFKNAPIYSLIVFVNKNLQNNISGKSNIIYINSLKSYINNLPNSNTNIPVKKIYKSLKTIIQKNIFKIYNHNKKIKKRK